MDNTPPTEENKPPTPMGVPLAQLKPGPLKPPALTIYERIERVTGVLARLKKEGENQAQGYKFVKIEDVVDTLRPLLNEQGLFLQWDTVGYELIETKTAKGYPAWLCKLVTRLTIYDTSGDILDCGQTFAMAIDSGDKAVTKAETSARKYSLIKAFNLSTGDDLEDDSGDKKPEEGGGKKPKQQRLVPGKDRKTGIARLMVTLHTLAKYDPERAERLLDEQKLHDFLAENFDGIRSLNDLSDDQFSHLLGTVEKALAALEARAK